MHVSLAEALEVRGGPLEEEEIWAVLSQSAECLQDLFHKADPIALGFIISPWSLLLLPSGNISYTDENVSNQDLRAFTAPEVLQSRPLSCLSDVEKMHVYSLGMTLYWGADYKIPLDQPIKLGDHLNSILLNMCEDLMYTRVTIRTILDACSAHIRNSNCAPAFSYIKQLVKLVLGSLTTLNRLSLNTISKPDRNQEIRDRLRGKGLPIENSKKEAPKGTEKYKAQFCERASLNRGLSKSMGFLAITDKKSNMASCHTASGQEDTVEVYNKPRSRNCFDRKQNTIGDSGHWKLWTSTVDLDFDGSKVISSGDNTHWRSLSPQGKGRQIKCITQAREPKYRDFGHVPTTLGFQNPPQTFQLSTSSALSEAYERIKERQRKLQVLREAMVMDEPTGLHSAHHSDIYSTASESTSLVSSDPDNRPVHRNDDIRRYSSQTGEDEFLAESYISKKRSSSLYEIPGDENIVSQELMLKRQEEELKQLQNKLNRKQFQSGVHQADMVKVSMLDITRDPLRDVAIETSMTQRKLKNFFGPEFVKMISEPSVALELPASILTKSGKGEDIRRKVNIMLLSGQCLELTCDTKSTCKDVFDMVVAHIGLVEHHFFSLAYLKENEFFFVAPDCKLSKVAPEGWKEAKKKNRLTVNFILFLRIKFSVEDVGLIQHTLTRHQYYLQLRRDILEERLHCNDETAMLLASLALQAEFGDYQPEFHGMSYYRLEHYLPIGVIESLEESYVKEELPKLHSTYCGATEAESELEFLKICQKLSEYGVLFYRVLPEKKSLTGINLGICSKGVMVYEIQNGLKTVVLRFPWRDTKKIAFTRKKITLQNTSDGIKHQFQTDSSKTCQYLIHLASSQHKFQLQMRARKNNQDLQEIESLSVSNLNYNGDSAGLFSMGRVNSSISLAASAHSRLTDQSHLMRSELLKRMSRSEAALNQPLYDISKDKIYRTLWDQHPPILSKSSYDLRQVSESKRRSTPNFSYQLFRSSNLLEGDTERKVKHSCHRSDTESVVGSERRIKNSVINPKKSQAVLHRSPARRNPGSDSSSTEEAYAIGISMHSSGIPSTPATLTANDTLHQKFSALPSPERELRCIRLKKDVKHGLGFQIVGGEKTGKLDLGIFVTTIMPGGPAELDHRLKPGDRLISVNGITLEGITHDRAVEILQNAPEDVTLVVSQLKEKLYRGTDFSSGTRNKSRSPCRNLGRRDYEEVSSSEEHNGSSGHHRTLPVRTSVPPEEKRRGSTSSQDSRTESAGLSQSQVHGFYRNRTTSRTPQRTDYEEVSALTDLRQDMIQNVLDSARPLNSTNVETPKETDCSDRGDSDMDEATYSSSQEQQSSKKDSVADKVKRRAFPEAKQSTLLKPGDIFEVELSKIENSLGISVTGGINTSVRHGGIYVKGIIPGGAAEADGRIKKGDRVLSVNGICLEGATHKQAVETLRSTGQVVNLLVEKGQLPAASVHAPVTPQCTPPCAANQSTSCESADKQEVVPEIMSSNAKDCTSINDGDIFKVKLIKNSSGLGFSFTEGNDGFPEHNGNAVKIKKLFAGQPAAESGKINVGDVIMQVNDISLKGLSKQEIVSVLRRTSQEVTLLLYRLKSGVSADIGSPLSVRDSQTNEAYRSKLQKQSLDNLLISGKMNTSIVDEEDVEVERELQNPRDSYRDCSNADDVDKCPILKDHVAKCSMLKDEFSNKKMTTISQLPGNATSFSSSQYKMPSRQEETFQNIYFSPQESSRHELINRKPPSPMLLDHAPQQGFKLQPVVPSPTPVDANCISCSSASEMDSSISDTIAIPAQHQDSKNLEEEDSELQPEVELHVTLKKSEKGSLGFTVTKGDANIGSYIHDIIQDPAKSDGRLRPGDRLIMVNGVDITSMSHAEAVEFLRSIPDTVTLVIGRVLEIPEFPIKPHSLPDITLMWHKHELGLSVAGGSDTACQSIYISDISPGSVADKEGSLQPLDIIHHINGVSTHGMTTNEAKRTLQNAGPTVTLKVTRDGEPVFAKAMECSVQSNDKCLKRNESVEVNGDIYGNRQNECDQVSSVEVPKNNVIHFELQKPITGGLGFSLVGGENGAFVKRVHPGGAADVDGRLQVGDQLLKVNGECVVGMSHTKAVTTIRKAKGLVNLTVSRAKSSSEMRSTTKDADSKDSFSKVQHHTGISDPEAEVLKSLSDVVQQEVNKYFSFNPTNSTPKDTPGKGTHFVKTPDTVEYIGELKEEEMSAKSEDTDYEGFSLPEDSPEQPRKNDYHLSTSIEKIIQEVSVEDASESQTLVENTEKGEVAWRSEELPIDTLQQDVSSIDEWPITKEKLATLSVVKVPLASQYTGSKLDAIVKTLHRLLDQQIPSQEFEHLQDLKPLDECLIGQTKDNRRKNRYKNILPYDGTRVPIGEEHEYINASFIKIPVDKHDYIYIACQGPLPHTLADFWQMVWEQESNVIAMMTLEVEGGKVKCQRYWPEHQGKSIIINNKIKIILQRCQSLEEFIIRKIEMINLQSGESRQVTHLNFTAWPDHGTPDKPEQLVAFLSYMRHIKRTGSLIVHCSAGIGRSGTLICLDTVLTLISKGLDFDISHVVETMRCQRYGMIQTEAQYIFCYQVILYILTQLQLKEKETAKAQ